MCLMNRLQVGNNFCHDSKTVFFAHTLYGWEFASPQRFPLANLRRCTDPDVPEEYRGLNTRIDTRLDMERVERMAEALREGRRLPVIVTLPLPDDLMLTVSGNTRTEAFRLAGLEEVYAYVIPTDNLSQVGEFARFVNIIEGVGQGASETVQNILYMLQNTEVEIDGERRRPTLADIISINGEDTPLRGLAASFLRQYNIPVDKGRRLLRVLAIQYDLTRRGVDISGFSQETLLALGTARLHVTPFGSAAPELVTPRAEQLYETAARLGAEAGASPETIQHFYQEIDQQRTALAAEGCPIEDIDAVALSRARDSFGCVPATAPAAAPSGTAAHTLQMASRFRNFFTTSGPHGQEFTHPRQLRLNHAEEQQFRDAIRQGATVYFRLFPEDMGAVAAGLELAADAE